MTGEIYDAIMKAVQPLSDGLQRIEEKVESIRAAVDGNGRPGIKERVTSVETAIKVLAWCLGIFMPVVVAVACWGTTKLLPGGS